MTLAALSGVSRTAQCEWARMGNKIYGDDFVAFCFSLTRRLLDSAACTRERRPRSIFGSRLAFCVAAHFRESVKMRVLMSFASSAAADERILWKAERWSLKTQCFLNEAFAEKQFLQKKSKCST
jgi:hypothetical protein